MLKPATHSSVPPYCALTAGPNSHSPEPTLAPANSTPGPTSRSQVCQPRGGEGGIWPTVHGGNKPAGTRWSLAAAEGGTESEGE